MLAAKPRHAEDRARPDPRPSDAIRVVGTPHRPHASPARDMHAMIEAKLATGAVAPAPSKAFSPVAKMVIVVALATAAWTPIIATTYAFSL